MPHALRVQYDTPLCHTECQRHECISFSLQRLADTFILHYAIQGGGHNPPFHEISMTHFGLVVSFRVANFCHERISLFLQRHICEKLNLMRYARPYGLDMTRNNYTTYIDLVSFQVSKIRENLPNGKICQVRLIRQCMQKYLQIYFYVI